MDAHNGVTRKDCEQKASEFRLTGSDEMMALWSER